MRILPDFNTILILDIPSLIIYSIYVCGVLIATFYLGFKLGQNYGVDE
jgi:hypothetical protein